jgi:hypothetical protein
MRDPARFRLLVAATVVLLGLVIVTSRCGSDNSDAGDATGTATGTATGSGATGAAVATTTPVEASVIAPDAVNADPAATTTLAPRPGDPDAPLADPEGTGRELAQRFLDILTQRNPRPALEEFLSPSFQLQRANGTFADREEYLDTPAVVVRARILPEGFRAYQDGAVLTVRFTVDIQETTTGEAVAARQADRLAVFRRGTDGWKLVAWANFNPA